MLQVDLVERLAKLNEERQLLEGRLAPLESQIGQGQTLEITFEMVRAVMRNFVNNYKNTLTTEQRKLLLQLLIKEITIANNKQIDSIKILLNNAVVKHFTEKGEGKSSDNDFSSPFLVCFDIWKEVNNVESIHSIQDIKRLEKSSQRNL